jgi:Spy/CpxP family protein refolding chaperone
MRWQFCSFVLSGLLTAGVMLAQEPAVGSGQAAASQVGVGGVSSHHDGDRSKKLDKRLAHMTKRYKLTADQQSQIKSILQKEQQDAQLVNLDTFMSRGDRREEMSNVFEASQQKIGAILTDRQRRKFDADEKVRAREEGRLPWPNPGPALNGSW